MARLDERSCQSLAVQGLYIEPKVDLALQLSFNQPVLLQKLCRVVRCSIDAFSAFKTQVQSFNVAVGRYCTIGEGTMLGGVEPSSDNFSVSPAFHGQSFSFAGITAKANTMLVLNPALNPVQCIDQPFNAIKIGHDVWMGEGVLIAKGVEIGHGAIIKSGSVITKNVPNYAIVQGQQNIVGFRYSDKQIEQLLKLEWWRYNLPEMLRQGYKIPLQDIVGFMHFFQDTPPEKLIAIKSQWLTLNIS